LTSIPAPRRTRTIPDLAILATVAALFAATLVHATLGFGTALVAMPLLAMTVGVRVATPLVGLVVLTNVAMLLARTWRSVDLRVAWRLLLSSAVGIPVGVLTVRFAPEQAVKAILGVLLIAFGLYSFAHLTPPHLKRQGWLYVFGFTSGVLGGAYNTNAPPVVAYGALHGWPAERFQATLQGYFLPTAVLICAGHALGGLWTHSVFGLYLAALPFAVLAIFLGRRLSNHIPAATYQHLLYGALIVLGLLLLW
jgi:uncharacterized protein